MPTLLYVPINISALGNTVLVTGNTDTPTIQVLGIYFQCNVGTTVTIKAGTTAFTGPMSFLAGGGLNLPMNGTNVYYEADNGSNLTMDLTGLTGQVGGALMYYQF